MLRLRDAGHNSKRLTIVAACDRSTIGQQHEQHDQQRVNSSIGVSFAQAVWEQAFQRLVARLPHAASQHTGVWPCRDAGLTHLYRGVGLAERVEVIDRHAVGACGGKRAGTQVRRRRRPVSWRVARSRRRAHTKQAAPAAALSAPCPSIHVPYLVPAREHRLGEAAPRAAGSQAQHRRQFRTGYGSKHFSG